MMTVATGFPPKGGSQPDRPESGHAAHAAPAYGALDLGTNNCRLLIAVPDTESAEGAARSSSGRPIFRVIDAFSRIVRLGEGLSQTGTLAEPAMARTIAALRVCASKLRRHRVAAARLVATEACRRAANCEQFLARVQNETGLVIETISCEDEARLALAGCAPLLVSGHPHALVFDIGGGSTELSWLEVGPDAQPGRIDVTSIPLGVVTLGERYGGDHVSADTYARMVDEVSASLLPFERAHGIRALCLDDKVQMLGTSGTVTTLAGIHLDLARYDRSVVDGSYLSFDAVSRITQRLAALDYERRAQHPCIGRDRADLVLAGCAILEAICRQWPIGRLRVADRGIREGILCGLMRRDGVGRRTPGAVQGAVAIAERALSEPAH